MAARGQPTGLARSDALHIGLTGIVLEGGDLGVIAREVAEALDLGAAFTSTDGRERGAHLTAEQRERLVEAEVIEPSGRIRVERLGGQGLQVPGPSGTGWVRTLRVAAGGTDLARLVAYREQGEITEEDVHALERAAIVGALVITRQDAVSTVENKYRGDFLRDVFLRRAGDPPYVAEHAAGFGWDLRRPLVVVVAELDPATKDESTSQARRRQWQERFAAAWRMVTEQQAPASPSVDFGNEVVTLLPVDDATGSGPPGAQVVTRAVRAVAGDKGGGRRSFSVGVSRIADSVADLPDAFAQAERAVSTGRRIRGPGSTTHFDQLGVHRLIALVPERAELESFTRDVLGPLAEPTEEAASLRETLQKLLDTNFNVAEAARLQFFHYNTMRYRLGKLERLLGPVSTDPDLRLDVAVALRVLEIGA